MAKSKSKKTDIVKDYTNKDVPSNINSLFNIIEQRDSQKLFYNKKNEDSTGKSSQNVNESQIIIGPALPPYWDKTPDSSGIY